MVCIFVCGFPFFSWKLRGADQFANPHAGNNELRIGRKEKFTDSLEKWHRVMQMASKYENVHCSPKQIQGVWIVPLCSWYEPGLDPLYDSTHGYQVRTLLLL